MPGQFSIAADYAVLRTGDNERDPGPCHGVTLALSRLGAKHANEEPDDDF